MTKAILSIYRTTLGERFAGRSARRGASGAAIAPAEADRLAEALSEAYAEAPYVPRGDGMRLAAGFGVEPERLLRHTLEGGEGAAAATPFAARAAAAHLAAPTFGETLFVGAKTAILIGEETLLADPIPGLVAAMRAAPEGRASTAPLLESAIRALGDLAPLIDAEVLHLVAPHRDAARGDPDPRIATAQRAAWSAAIDALSVDPEPGTAAVVARLSEDYARLAAAGDADPLFSGASAPARRFAEMAATAESYDLREIDAATSATAAVREWLAIGRWDGWSDAASALPRLDDAATGLAAIAVDLGPAADPARLPLAEATALRLGEEAFAARRALLTDALAEASAGRSPSFEIVDELAAWARIAGDDPARLGHPEAFAAGWRARLDLRARSPLSAAAIDGLARLASDWPEQALIADLATDAACEASADAPAPARLRGRSATLLAP